MSKPPPLPPRSPSIASTASSFSDDDAPPRYTRARVDTVHLTPYSTHGPSKQNQSHPYGASTGLDDPRSSSTQSLLPTESAGPNRRRLLLVYIHGFMGTETSFKSFPAHVHNLLTMSLADSHVVHTKIYPRYQSRKNISYARDDFSNWLTPHESEDTDIILIGHSLGGILAAEVVLLPSHRPGSSDLFQHHILGHIAYDTPFLGMHPGVVSTGIASLFRSAPDPPESPQPDHPDSAELSTDPFTDASDPNYNPAYANDVHLPNRKGKMDQAFYFLKKHYGNIGKATTSYVKSHLEFGGCLADYDGLKKRYKAFRPLEDVDAFKDTRTQRGKAIPRVRFVNYYTASTGRIKPQPPPEENEKHLVAETEMTEFPPSNSALSATSSQTHTPRISVDEYRADEIVSKDLDDLHLGSTAYDSDNADMVQLDPQAEPPSPEVVPSDTQTSIESPVMDPITASTSIDTDTLSLTPSQLSLSKLPPLPAPPTPPAPFEAGSWAGSDPATIKLAQKEHDRAVKAYERAKKDHDKNVREREKYLAKVEKARQKQEEKETAGLSAHEKHERERLKQEAERMRKEKERLEGPKKQDEAIKRAATLNQDQYDAALARQAAEEDAAWYKKEQARAQASKPKPPKKQRDRKFCTLPKKDERTGTRDSTWIRVYMENMDEVVAHTSLFFVSDTYAKLVGDTAERVEQWVRDDATVRAVKAAQAWEDGK